MSTIRTKIIQELLDASIHDKRFIIEAPSTISSVSKRYETLSLQNQKISYFEIQLDNLEGACRVGFAKKGYETMGPLGIDSNGFSFGTKNGYRFHQCKRYTSGGPVTEKDIISCFSYIYNPENSKNEEIEYCINEMDIGQKTAVIHPRKNKKTSEILKNSNIRKITSTGKKYNVIEFYINGKKTEGSFISKIEINSELYPAISIYGDCKIRMIVNPDLCGYYNSIVSKHFIKKNEKVDGRTKLGRSLKNSLFASTNKKVCKKKISDAKKVLESTKTNLEIKNESIKKIENLVQKGDELMNNNNSSNNKEIIKNIKLPSSNYNPNSFGINSNNKNIK